MLIKRKIMETKSTDKKELNALIALAQQGDSGAFARLLDRYEPLISSTVAGTMAKMPELTEADAEDLRQEAILAFYSSLVSYDFSISNVEFGLYAKVCICNRLVSQMRIMKRRLSHSAPMYSQDDIMRLVAEDSDPASRIIELESERSLLKLISESLSKYEYRVFTMYISGMSASDMASELDTTEKSVNNAVFRIRRKLRVLLKNNKDA